MIVIVVVVDIIVIGKLILLLPFKEVQQLHLNNYLTYSLLVWLTVEKFQNFS